MLIVIHILFSVFLGPLYFLEEQQFAGCTAPPVRRLNLEVITKRLLDRLMRIGG